MKKHIRKAAIILSSLAIGACATQGRDFDINAIDSFVPGETTNQEVIAKIGNPTTTQKFQNGDFVLGWSYTKTTHFGSKGKMAQIQFSPNGKMKKMLSKFESEN